MNKNKLEIFFTDINTVDVNCTDIDRKRNRSSTVLAGRGIKNGGRFHTLFEDEIAELLNKNIAIGKAPLDEWWQEPIKWWAPDDDDDDDDDKEEKEDYRYSFLASAIWPRSA